MRTFFESVRNGRRSFHSNVTLKLFSGDMEVEAPPSVLRVIKKAREEVVRDMFETEIASESDSEEESHRSPVLPYLG